MGLISATLSAVGSTLSDQWREYFYCEALPENVLAVKGQKRGSAGGSDNVISNGSIIAVADGQCAMIVVGGRIAEFCAEPGEFLYDTSTEPSIFYGDLKQNILETFKVMGMRFTFGGEVPTDQRVYYFNLKELIGNKYGTPSPVPFRVVDQNIGLDVDISIRCFGEFSYRICDPMLFYKNVCGNVTHSFTREELDGQLKTELMTALQPAFGKLSEMGVRYSALPAHTQEMADALNEVLSARWRDQRGLEIAAFGITSVKASEEDEAMIKELQRTAALRDPNMAAAHMVQAQAEAMQSAASNTAAGPAFAFMGMNMAQNAGGVNAGELFQMGQQQPAAQQSASEPDSWVCACGAKAFGKFCAECGAKRPEAQPDGWTCACGTVNKGKFCTECGAKKPAGVPQYRCDKCGWEPPKGSKPPRFCPECGDPFDDGDLVE